MVVAIVLAGVGVGGTAFAGEHRGNGDETPVKSRHVASSICAFSELEDGEEGDQPSLARREAGGPQSPTGTGYSPVRGRIAPLRPAGNVDHEG